MFIFKNELRKPQTFLPDVQWVLVTPQLAEYFLQQNTKNRNVNSVHKKNLSIAMTRNEWEINGDSLRFYKDLSLADGQHRLIAIISSGVAQWMLVVSSLLKRCESSIDGGKKRSNADHFTFTGEKNAALVSGAVNVLANYKEGTLYALRTISPVTLLKCLNENQSIRNSAMAVSKIKHILIPSVAVFVHYMANNINPTKANLFFQSMSTGNNLCEHSPVLKLRDILIKNITSTKKFKKSYVIGITIKAWNLYLFDKKVKRLYLRMCDGNQIEFPDFATEYDQLEENQEG